MGTPTHEEIRTQLAKLLASPQFVRAGRMSRFLRFTIEHAIAGTGDKVKEYLVGVEVFDRSKDYDPRVDPIVRVEARRLREKIASYYQSGGKCDPVQIEYPKGVYTPTFTFRLRNASAAEAPAAKSIAVLPFENFSGDEAGDYFSDGLTEEIILLLTRVPELRVVAWQSAAQFRGREQDLGSIRAELNADVVLRGSVRRSAARVRVTAQLVDTAGGAYLWSEGFNRQLDDVVSIQEEIARSIVETLKLALNPPRESAAPKRVNLDCYNLCLQARFLARGRAAEGLRRSLDCYTRAIAADPESAAAHAGLAGAYSLLADYGIMHPSEAMPRAEDAAQRALALDPASAEANTALAFIHSVYDWKWQEAEALYRRAIALNPSFAQARHWFGADFLIRLGRFEEAEPHLQLARDLDPLSLITHDGSAYLRLLHRDYAGCERELEQIVALDPSFYKAYAGLGRVMSLTGRYEEGVVMFEKARRFAGNTPTLIAALGHTQALAGRTEEANRSLEQLHSLAEGRYVPSTSFAIVHLGLADHSRALDWLERACDQREVPLTLIGVHPLYDPLRTEPRFQALLKRVGLLR